MKKNKEEQNKKKIIFKTNQGQKSLKYQNWVITAYKYKLSFFK